MRDENTKALMHSVIQCTDAAMTSRERKREFRIAVKRAKYEIDTEIASFYELFCAVPLTRAFTLARCWRFLR